MLHDWAPSIAFTEIHAQLFWSVSTVGNKRVRGGYSRLPALDVELFRGGDGDLLGGGKEVGSGDQLVLFVGHWSGIW